MYILGLTGSIQVSLFINLGQGSKGIEECTLQPLS